LKKHLVLFSVLAVFLFAVAMFAPVFALTGDVNHDGKVDIKDLAIVASAYGSSVGDPRYNPDADVYPVGSPDGKIDIHDLAIVAKNFGSS